MRSTTLTPRRSAQEKAVEAEPDAPLAYFCLLTISLKQQKFAETSRLLKIVHDKFPQRMPKVEAEPAYAEYIRTRHYRTWMKEQTGPR